MRRDQRDLMIESQAEHISKLREQVVRLQKELDSQWHEIERYRVPAKFYNDLQQQIQSNPILQSEWERFLTFLKMAGDEDYLEDVGAFS